MEATHPNKLASFVYNAMICATPQTPGNRRFALWQRVWLKTQTMFSGPVSTTIHGQPAIVNYGNTYPITSRLYSSYNNPLVELVYQSHRANKRGVTLIDVGAATGDTILLLQRNCPDMISAFCCVDGDAEFMGYLQNNVSHFKGSTILNALLSSEEGQERALIRTHGATASAQGEASVRSITLDRLISEADLPTVDVLKIDVDGFDGRVLLGSRKLLETSRPAIIFEWHPILYKQTGNDLFTPFETLAQHNYSRLLFYDKFGKFSHFVSGFAPDTLTLLADLCLNSAIYTDWHYDVIALHDTSIIPPLSLAESAYAQNRCSRY